EVQENTNTTKVISIKSRTEINKLPTSGIVTEEKFIEFNKLIQENRTFNKEDRKESLLVILNSIQEYFKKIFGDKILELIKEGKTLQIHFNNQTSSTLNLIYLYQNAQDFYQSLIEEEISTMIDNELIQT
ncbi:MAG: hypothetical protein JXR48_14430, partial [Candidatus Delongbacteria bacterium]|nr:hypothetical protein [Candidatus Delongbacteria bacterium]